MWFLKLVLGNLERSLLIAALLFAGVMGYLYNKEKATREMMELTSNGLPPGILAKYIQKNRELTKLIKDAEGKTRVERIYVPDEGKVITITRERDAAIAEYKKLLEEIKNTDSPEEIRRLKERLNQLLEEVHKPPEIIVKNKGFTSRFGYGLVFNPDFSTTITGRRKTDLPLTPSLDWKFGYWKRWSAGVQLNPYFFGPMVTRHVDDLLPKVNWNNIEIGLTGGYKWSGGTQLGIILRSNF